MRKRDENCHQSNRAQPAHFPTITERGYRVLPRQWSDTSNPRQSGCCILVQQPEVALEGRCSIHLSYGRVVGMLPKPELGSRDSRRQSQTTFKSSGALVAQWQPSSGSNRPFGPACVWGGSVDSVGVSAATGGTCSATGSAMGSVPD